MRETVLRVDVAYGGAITGGAAPAIAGITISADVLSCRNLTSSLRGLGGGRWGTTYSPPEAFSPKLLPTVSVNVQVWPAELVHVAVAVAPTVKHVTLRLSRGEAGLELGAARVVLARGSRARRRYARAIVRRRHEIENVQALLGTSALDSTI